MLTEAQNLTPQPDDSIQSVTEDYFGTDTIERYYMPDKIQYIEYKVFAEGERQRFQDASNKDIRIDRVTNSAHLKMTPGSERRALLETAVCGWYMFQKGQQVAFSTNSPGSTFMQWLNKAPTAIVDGLEKAIRLANPWLLGDMSSEDIAKEIENLKQMHAVAVERERGEGSSSSK